MQTRTWDGTGRVTTGRITTIRRATSGAPDQTATNEFHERHGLNKQGRTPKHVTLFGSGRQRTGGYAAIRTVGTSRNETFGIFQADRTGRESTSLIAADTASIDTAGDFTNECGALERYRSKAEC